MMGKLHSKHADCIFVDAELNKALEDNIWKKKTGFNLANYNMDETLSELSICLEEKPESSPLRVDLPPPKLDTETSKVLRLDHIGIRRAGRHGGGKGKNKLNIEEFECGVHLEGSETAKQEWSFTLYDFDGHGRITKEDLSSLLKALYDAVGSSIKLPPNGAKTLKLRLSVGQDGAASTLRQMTQAEADCTGSNNGKNNFNNISSSSKKNNNLSAAGSGGGAAARATERSRNTARAPKNKVREFSKVNNLTRAASTEQKQHKQQQVKRTNEHRGLQQARVTSLASAIQLAPPPSVCSGNRDSGLFLPTAGHTQSDESSPLEAALPSSNSAPSDPSAEDQAQASATAHALPDHQRLADLVQENMERNRVRQQLRRLSEHRADGHQRYHHHHHPLYNHHSRQHRRRHHRTTTTATSQRRVSSLLMPDAPGADSADVEDGGGMRAGGGAAETRDAKSGRLVDPSTTASVSHRWHGRKSTKCSNGEDTEEEDGGRDGGRDTGCVTACELICHCRRRDVSAKGKLERKTFRSVREDSGGGPKEWGVGNNLSKKEEEGKASNDSSKKEEEGKASSDLSKKEEERKASNDLSKKEDGRAEESQDRRNYYLDLAGVENTSSRFQNSSRSPHGRPGCSRRGHKGHHRSRSQDLATAHVSTSGDIKFSNVVAGNGSTNHSLVYYERGNDLQATSDVNNCLCKPTSSNKCDNLLFSAVAFGLALASEAEKSDRNCGRQKGDEIAVGNDVVRMLATAASQTEAGEYQHHGRSKSSDPHDTGTENGEPPRRGQRSQRPVQHSEHTQQGASCDRTTVDLAGHSLVTPTKLNSLNSGSSTTTTTTATTTTDNNHLSGHTRGKKFRPLSLPGHVPACVSPHHHRRHRHRDKDHSQAMQQVAQWIEREQHAWDQNNLGTAATAGSHILVQRHEHHHIHEHHHHHHYHHYHET